MARRAASGPNTEYVCAIDPLANGRWQWQATWKARAEGGNPAGTLISHGVTRRRGRAERLAEGSCFNHHMERAFRLSAEARKVRKTWSPWL